MIYKELTEIPYESERAIIINCGTRLSTTLSILSALRYLDIPVLVIDCPVPNTAGNGQSDYGYFTELQRSYQFDLISMPLRKHGDTLDSVFTQLSSDYICLIDSDLEILNDKAIGWMREYVQLADVFGSGFSHGPLNHFLNMKNGYYARRMWIPFTLLKTKPIKERILGGVSFNIDKRWNDIPWSEKWSKRCYKYLTIRYSLFDKSFNLLRKKYGTKKPACALFDTGAHIYESLEQEGLTFAGPQTSVCGLYVTHFDGITRNLLDNRDSTATSIDSVDAIITQRLLDEYHFDITKSMVGK